MKNYLRSLLCILFIAFSICAKAQVGESGGHYFSGDPPANTTVVGVAKDFFQKMKPYANHIVVENKTILYDLSWSYEGINYVFIYTDCQKDGDSDSVLLVASHECSGKFFQTITDYVIGNSYCFRKSLENNTVLEDKIYMDIDKVAEDYFRSYLSSLSESAFSQKNSAE